MTPRQAVLILARLTAAGWAKYPELRRGDCLLWAAQIALGDEATVDIVGELGEAAGRLYPERRRGVTPAAKVAFFNDHRDTTEDDVRQVVMAAVTP